MCNIMNTFNSSNNVITDHTNIYCYEILTKKMPS